MTGKWQSQLDREESDMVDRCVLYAERFHNEDDAHSLRLLVAKLTMLLDAKSKEAGGSERGR